MKTKTKAKGADAKMNGTNWDEVLAYIDSHVTDALTVADIAGVAGYSAFHFNRLFAARMGMPAMEYMRMRRLQYGAKALMQGGRVLDIALCYGFSSHEAFTRAFKRLFGLSPQRFRLIHNGPYRVPPHRLWRGIPKGGIPMEPRKEIFQERTLVGYRIHTQPGSAQIPQLWNDIMADDRWERLIEKAAPGALNYGLCLHDSDIPDGIEMDYMIAFDYDGTSPIDKDMALYILKAATYMAFPVEINTPADTSEGIKKCWSEIYSDWFPSSKLSYDQTKPDFEAYYGHERVEIFIPILA